MPYRVQGKLIDLASFHGGPLYRSWVNSAMSRLAPSADVDNLLVLSTYVFDIQNLSQHDFHVSEKMCLYNLVAGLQNQT